MTTLNDLSGKGEAVALWAAFAPEGNLLAHSKLRPGLSDILNWEPLYRTAPQAECATLDKQEAVYQVLSDNVHAWIDVRKFSYEQHEGHKRIVYTAPQAECVYNDEHVEAFQANQAAQAECAPREKQNVMNIPLDAAAAMADYAAPTPERAQESAGVRLTPEQSGAIQIAISILTPAYGLTANRLRSILAANKGA
jgi:hypothetical protein